MLRWHTDYRFTIVLRANALPVSLAGCDAYGTISVGDEDVPRELNLKREKTKEEKLGIVFKTVNKVRLVVEIVVHRCNFALFQ